MTVKAATSELRASLSVLGNEGIRRAEAALLVSELTGPAYATALFVFAYSSGGAGAVGVVALAVMLPSAFVAPFAGLLADRGRRSRVAAIAAALRSALLVGTAAAMLAGLPLVAVTILAALASIPSRVFYPAHLALLPRLTRSDAELDRTIALGTTIENLGSVAGPAIGAAMLLATGPPGVVAACGAAMLVAAACAVRVDEPCVATTQHERTGTRAALAEVAAGGRLIARHPTLRAVISVYGFQTAVFGVLSVATVELALARFHAGEGGVGLVNAALGVGGIVGGCLALAISTRLANGPALRLGTLLWGLPLVLVAGAPTLPVAFALLTVVGVGNVLVDVSAYALIQRATEDAFRGRVFGALEGIAVGAVALGSLVGGVAIDQFGVSTVLCAAGLSLAVAALLTGSPERTATHPKRSESAPGATAGA